MKISGGKFKNFLLPSIAVTAVFLVLFGCSGSDGAAGAKGDTGPAGTVNSSDVEAAAISAVELAAIQPESCAICHSKVGEKKHQDIYDSYKDTSKLALAITNVASVAGTTAGTFDTTITFTITNSGLPYADVDGLPGLEQKTFYAVPYDSSTRTYGVSKSFSSIKATATTGTYTAVAKGITFDVTAAGFNGQIFGYVADDLLETEGMKLYDNVASAAKAYGDVATYTSYANVSGCEKCHGKPYMKHGYRSAAVTGLSDFSSCKSCHYDTRTGGHTDWQLLVDNPQQYAAYHAKIDPSSSATDAVNDFMTAAEKTQYAYKAKLMNDVHMAHAMEFPYPQSMANCVTCHEGKLSSILTDANFKPETCVSCHPLTGATGGTEANRAPALKTLWTSKNVDFHTNYVTDGRIVDSTACNYCHKSGGIAPIFSKLHTGYNKMIYADADGKKYSNIFKVSIDSVSLSTNKLTIKFSASETGNTTTLKATAIAPTLMIGLYGYDTKDFLIGSHGKSIDNNRDLEYVVGAAGNSNTRFTTVAAANGSWTVTADLSAWADKIAAGIIKRAEIAVMPELKDASGRVVALDAPSKTFDLVTKAFDTTFFKDIIDVANCNKCHEALATTFHSANRGGNIKVCRLCHVPTAGGYHLEMQSRSIDSWVHAIHSFQAFDVGRTDFTDPVEKMRYELHIEHVFPNFTIKNCEACHKAGTYNVPDQAKSLPGILSASDTSLSTFNMDRSIGDVQSYVTGPAARACGACHRANLIKEDDAPGITAFYQHTKVGGYLVKYATGVLDAVIDKIMSIFN